MDTGCTKTLVHQDLVPRGKIVQDETLVIHVCMGTVLYTP